MNEGLLFSKIDVRIKIEQKEKALVYEIENLDRGYLLQANEGELCDYLVSKYYLNLPSLRRDKICVDNQRETIIDAGRFDRSRTGRKHPVYERGTTVTIAVPFDGDGELFFCRPTTINPDIPEGKIVDQELHLTYTVLDTTGSLIERLYKKDLANIESNLKRLHEDVRSHNGRLQDNVQSIIGKRKEKLLADEKMVNSLGIPVRRRPGDSLTFTPPEIKRKPVIRRPEMPAGKSQIEPALAEEEYDYILKVIENMVLVMERSPKAFAEMVEEDLRNHFLVQLNGHYEGQATGETFNYTGKTDILIRSEGKNIFIAECMFWDGPQSLLDKIDQLLGYTSWRDTKTAILIFNRKRNFSTVLQNAFETVPKHSCYRREHGKRSETHSRYIFHQPDDINRELFLAVLAFNVPSDH